MIPPLTLQITPWPWSERRATQRSPREVVGARNILGGHDLVAVVDDAKHAVANAKFIAGSPTTHFLSIEAVDRWDDLIAVITAPLPIRQHIAAISARDALVAHLRSVS